MFLYNLTLQKGGEASGAVVGTSPRPRRTRVVARNKTLELLRPDEHGKTNTVFSTEVFGIIRSLAAFRLTGEHDADLAVGSDSGRVVISRYDALKPALLDDVHEETRRRRAACAASCAAVSTWWWIPRAARS